MKYLVYLNHYNSRQNEAQYLHMFYSMLDNSLDSIFVLSEEYLKDYSTYRWEVAKALERFKNKEELKKKIQSTKYYVMKRPDQLIQEKVPSKLLYKTVNENIPEEVKTIEKVLEENDIGAAITWINNECLKETLAKHNIPVFHHESGPFRPPSYLMTFYLDFSGVNGNTEFNKRFKEFLKISNEVPIYSREELIRILSPNNYKQLLEILYNDKREYEAGVGLQVEVDTNLLLFNNGCSWVDPLLKAKAESAGQILVRPHPSAGFTLKGNRKLIIDDITKGSAVEFINKCNKIYCLNSSVGIEAMLLGRKADILGESPFHDMCTMDDDMQLKALNFAIFGYLVLDYGVCNDSYYDFRIRNKGDEKLIYLDNIKRFVQISKNGGNLK